MATEARTRYWWQERLEDGDDLPTACGHREFWLAPDGLWRCEVCQPPHFEQVRAITGFREVRGRRKLAEQLRLDEAA